jgi:hypothetical protein
MCQWDPAHIIREFRRVGIGAAVLTAVLGLALTTVEAINRYKRSDFNLTDVAVGLASPSPDGIFRSLNFNAEAFNSAIETVLIGLVATGAVSHAAYVLFYGFGRIIARFLEQ